MIGRLHRLLFSRSWLERGSSLLPDNTLIYVEFGLFVLLSWVVMAMLLRGLFRQREAAKAHAARRTQNWRDAKDELCDARLAIARLEQELAEALTPDVDMNTLLTAFESDLATEATALDELGSIQALLFESTGRLEAGNSTINSPANELLLKELALLREQNDRSGRLINSLAQALERNRACVRELEKFQRKRGGGHGAVNTELEVGYRRIAQENKSLHVRIKKSTETHQAALEQISDRLRSSELKYRDYVSEAKDQQQSMLSIIAHLREQLRASDGQQMSTARVEDLMVRVKELDDELQRALHERNFLDERYIELEQALSLSENAAQELDRAKIEYRMLEERYLEMEEHINQSIIDERQRNRIADAAAGPYREKGIDVITDDNVRP